MKLARALQHVILGRVPENFSADIMQRDKGTAVSGQLLRVEHHGGGIS